MTLRRACCVSLLAAAVVAWPTSATLASPAQAWVAERAARAVLDALDAANQVWPEFSMLERSWLAYDASGAYLHTPGTPPPGFIRRDRLRYVRTLAGQSSPVSVDQTHLFPAVPRQSNWHESRSNCAVARS